MRKWLGKLECWLRGWHEPYVRVELGNGIYTYPECLNCGRRLG